VLRSVLHVSGVGGPGHWAQGVLLMCFVTCVVQKNSGPPEVATCGRDGCVRVWDVRQHDAPVAAFEPEKADQVLP
jgi:hypothetical protein